jgi:hypothetical protein
LTGGEVPVIGIIPIVVVDEAVLADDELVVQLPVTMIRPTRKSDR